LQNPLSNLEELGIVQDRFDDDAQLAFASSLADNNKLKKTVVGFLSPAQEERRPCRRQYAIIQAQWRHLIIITLSRTLVGVTSTFLI